MCTENLLWEQVMEAGTQAPVPTTAPDTGKEAGHSWTGEYWGGARGRDSSRAVPVLIQEKDASTRGIPPAW